MPTYAIFHRESGEIVHVHIEPDELRTPREGLLEHVDPAIDRSDLDIAVCDRMYGSPDGTFRVDPKTRQVVIEGGRAEPREISFGGVTPVNAPPPASETIYERSGDPGSAAS